MATTVQIEEATLELLKRFKENMNAATYNEVIEALVKKALKQRSMRGYLGRMSRKEILKGLRDKHDRF